MSPTLWQTVPCPAHCHPTSELSPHTSYNLHVYIVYCLMPSSGMQAAPEQGFLSIFVSSTTFGTYMANGGASIMFAI